MRKNWIITIVAAVVVSLAAGQTSANTIIRADAHNILNWCEGQSYRYFSPNLLSTPNASITLDIEISEQGRPVCTVLKSEDASPADEFYCKQAVWEAAPIRPDPEWVSKFSGIKFQLDFPQKVKDRFGYSYWENLVAEKEKLSKIRRDFVSLHFIPASIAAKVSNSSTEIVDVDSPANIAKILDSKLKSPLLSQFREDWFEYATNNTDLTAVQIHEKSKELSTKYAKLFSE